VVCNWHAKRHAIPPGKSVHKTVRIWNAFIGKLACRTQARVSKENWTCLWHANRHAILLGKMVSKTGWIWNAFIGKLACLMQASVCKAT
jgi:hypothetical protein